MFPVPRSTEWKQKKLENTNRGRGTGVGKTAVTAPGYIYPRQAVAFWGEGRRPLPRALDTPSDAELLYRNYYRSEPEEEIVYAIRRSVTV